MTPTHLQAFENFSIMWFTNGSFESRVRPAVGVYDHSPFTSVVDLHDSVYEKR